MTPFSYFPMVAKPSGMHKSDAHSSMSSSLQLRLCGCCCFHVLDDESWILAWTSDAQYEHRAFLADIVAHTHVGPSCWILLASRGVLKSATGTSSREWHQTCAIHRCSATDAQKLGTRQRVPTTRRSTLYVIPAAIHAKSCGDPSPRFHVPTHIPHAPCFEPLERGRP